MSLLQWIWNIFHHPAPAPPPIPPPAPPPAGDPGPALLAAVNAFREAQGLPLVSLDPALSAGAAAFAGRLAAARTMDHFHGGTTPWARIAQALAPRPAGASGECLAVGQTAAAEVVAAWESDPPHRAILVGPYALAGFGLALGAPMLGGIPGRYWVADFATVMG